MRRVALANETDWDGWRKASRSLVLGGIPPQEVRWAVRSHDEDGGDPLREEQGSFGVSKALVSLASLAIQAREPSRFELLYRLVWRANANERVLEMDADEDIRRAKDLAFAVRAEAHRMRTQVRYLSIEGPHPRFLGWYEPAHFVLEANAPADRQALSGSCLLDHDAGRWRALGRGGDCASRPASARDGVHDDAGLRSWWRKHQAQSAEGSPHRVPRSHQPRSWMRSRGRPICRRSVPWCCRWRPTPRCNKRCTRRRIAAAATSGSRDADGVRRRASARQGDLRRRAARRSGGCHRPAICRPSGSDHGPGDGGGRSRPPNRLYHQCGQALQVRAARQAAESTRRQRRPRSAPAVSGWTSNWSGCSRSSWWRWAARRRVPARARRHYHARARSAN